LVSATIEGVDRFDAEGRKRFRRLVGVSLATHAIALLLLAFGPRFQSPPPGIPGVVTVDLVAAAPGPVPGPAAPVPAPAPPKPPPEPKVEAPKPAPEPVPVKPPPPPKPEKVVLPKEAVKAPEKAPPKPKAAPAPPVDYDQLMKQLRESKGESRPEPVQTAKAAPAPPDAAATGGGGGGGGTVKVSPEVMAWIRDARIHVRKNWVRAPGFQGLVTTLLVELDEGGNVVGEPTVKQRSGNPFYDDSVVRAIQKASPLPRPPMPGAWTFVFPSEEPTS
jgi:TonB family protein